MRAVFIVALSLACTTDGAPAKPWMSELADAIAASDAALSSVAGNGNSSGAAITAEILNKTASMIRVGIHLVSPLYLVNSGRAQNMVAVAVYGADGSYNKDSRGAYVALSPNKGTRVLFIAFCADFDKNNPTQQDRFTLGSLPTSLQPVVTRIIEHLRNSPETDLTVAGQAAIWMAQGVSLGEIRERFPVSDYEVWLARQLQ